MINEWRGFNLEKRVKNLKKAFLCESIHSPEEFALVINTPCYFGFGNNPRPKAYWDDPAEMVRFQEHGFERHLSEVDDDTMPYFMPWFGTGVLATAFGCPLKEATGNGDDPAVCGVSVQSVRDIARIKMPDPYNDGLMPKVLKFIDYAEKHSDLPVGLTDMNSPISTLIQICGYENTFLWMYDEPQAMHDMMSLITETFIRWVKAQKTHAGDALKSSNGLQGVTSPEGVGIWVSDDDLVAMNPELYAEFAVPYYSKIFTEFGGGSVHFCGNGLHQLDNILNIKNVRVINNSPMGKVDLFSRLVKKAGHGRLTIQIQDNAPVNIETYYRKLFEGVDDLRGLMLATWVLDTMGMEDNGSVVMLQREPLKDAQRIVRAVRKALEDRFF